MGAIYHGVGGCRRGALRPHPVSPSLPLTRVVAGVHNSNRNTQAGVRSGSGGRTKPASARFFFAFSPEQDGPNTWRPAHGGRATTPGARSRLRSGWGEARRGESHVCAFLRQPAEHVCACVAGCCGAVEAPAIAVVEPLGWWLPLR